MNDRANAVLSALESRRQIEPFTSGDAGFDLAAAYAVSNAILAARIERGERPVGWKIGFTNRTIWDEYGVHAPIWGPMYDSTVTMWDGGELPAQIDVARLIEPRIEPEIVFRMGGTPRADMDDTTLLACIEAVGHGFEIVQSVFPGWRFGLPDSAAAGALHGALVCGPMTRIKHADSHAWLHRLRAFEIDLLKDGETIDHGIAANVLDGPLAALRHFVAATQAMPMARGILRGDIVTTGTVTRAFPVAAGESWSTELSGLSLPGMRVRFA